MNEISEPDKSVAIKRLAAQTAISHMFSGGYFSICTVDTIATMFEIPTGGEAYRILRTLHCVKFRDMPEDLQREIPGLIRSVLADWVIKNPEPEPKEPRTSLFAMLTGRN